MIVMVTTATRMRTMIIEEFSQHEMGLVVVHSSNV